ncbi:nucleotidyl transferase AbiEii/AbiGii toxin family protein [Vineibacter terrae]|uniref:Nucleotidyl transferase AbiEii/AbiGii toxin family protein n=1 Tax=Vineibacter terrae TaxID=2586908 RepID=A0A5C8PFX7_9HYPH|nr:nucleotidyl transferase AbiEii/AbiGii toxin family protein [Vineibacter terrae]TXL72419.1 nucleotidyl transferase AbiEii/AbiGii toxin family protein [Vineibacter terrae]
MTKAPVNLAASARARLTQRARERRENAQLVMTRYAIERLLYRLSLSPFREAFVLKGAMLFSLWAPTPYRATGDLDLLGFGDNAPARVAEIFRQVLKVPSEDGVIFKPETLGAVAARAEDEYSGVSLDVQAELAGARLPIHVDIGYGDAITPGVLDIDYPSLLDLPMPRLKAYPPETVLAEKFQAMTALGIANSRMKDFFDVWAIANTFAFEGPVLAEAIAATFARRETELPAEPPLALSAAFAAAKQAQWTAFLRRTDIALAPEPFHDIQAQIAALMMPPAQAVAGTQRFDQKWQPGGPWRNTQAG